MSKLEIRLDWFRDKSGYSIVDRGVYGERIVDNGGPLVTTTPLNNDLIFKIFANLASAQDLLKFVKAFGLLAFPAYEREVLGLGTRFGPEVFTKQAGRFVQTSIELEGESVTDHLETAQLFRTILLQSSRGWKQGRLSETLGAAITDVLSNLELGTIGLIGDRRWGLRPTIFASSLMNGLWLQLATHIGQGAHYRVCELPSCGKLFSIGAKADRRSDARFCSSQHQIDSNSRRRSTSERR